MDDYQFSTYVCDDLQQMEATDSLIVPLLEGLGKNIQKQLGNVQLGRSVSFYEKLGYELFATLEDYPPGHCKYFLKKALSEGQR